MDLARYQAKSRDKLVNHSCQLVLVRLVLYYVIDPYFLSNFKFFTIILFAAV